MQYITERTSKFSTEYRRFETSVFFWTIFVKETSSQISLLPTYTDMGENVCMSPCAQT
jgi:hypothetical protein